MDPFSTSSNDLTELQLERLSAVRAALDSHAAKWQHDVLLSACVEILARGDHTCEQLTRALRTMWVTDAVTETVVDQVLGEGEDLGLVACNQTLGDTPIWTATGGARDDAASNRQWATDVVEQFERDLVSRLAELDVDLRPERHARVAGQLIQALAVGAAGTYEVRDNGIDQFLRPINFDVNAAHGWVRDNVEPASVRDACQNLVVSALNPLDELGNEILHLVVVGNLLRGVMSRRDVPHPIDLGDVRLLLDTSVLLDLVDDETAAQEQLLRLIDLTLRNGGEVVVADHTLDEWERLWEAADRENPDQVDSSKLPENAEILVRNKPAQIFLRLHHDDPSTSWIRFQLGRREIRPRLEQLGVHVRPAGNHRSEDIAVETEAVAVLERLDDDRRGRPRRRAAVEADAASLAMVARWRLARPGTPASGYFCARDRLTSAAYSEMFSEEPPLIVSPESWLLLMARLVAGDPAEEMRLAELVGTNAVREAFLGLATGYTVADALHVANIMSENDKFAAEDLQAVVQLDIDSVLAGGAESDARSRAEEALRLRSARRDGRAKREMQAARARQQHADERERLANQKIAEAAEQAELRVQEVESEADASLDSALDEQRVKHKRTVRWVIAAAMTLIALLAIGLIWATVGVPDGRGIGLHAVGLLAVPLAGADAALHPDRPWWELLLVALWGVLFTVLGALL